MSKLQLFTDKDLVVFGEAQSTMATISEISNAMEKSMIMVDTTMKVREILSKPEVIAKIMPLQNKPYGFLTDKKQNGYSEEEVLDCLTEATMQGVSFANNEFNIIAGKCYIAKNGMKSKLNYLPVANVSVKFEDYLASAKIVKVPAVVSWLDTETNTKCKETLNLVFRYNQTDSPDNLFGKGKRKAYAWLFERYTGAVVDDGDATDYIDITKTQKAEKISKTLSSDEYEQLILELNEFKISLKSAAQKHKGYEFTDTEKQQIKEAGTITPAKMTEIPEMIAAGTKTIEDFKFILNEKQLNEVTDFLAPK